VAGQTSARLEQRAIRERWPLPDSVRVQVLKRVVEMIDPETELGAAAKPRTILAATKTLLAADKLNIEHRRLDMLAGAEESQRIDAELVERAWQIRAERAARLALPAPETPSCAG
jgi:hypothetical protein